ncbi:MAG: hypothetical protein JWM12_2475 [Ilumatobacteraceae bacterium]|jgi:hypothetical protein|nr:hypothetical protein [Ilumatobacteraceae bacterium]
MSDLQIEVLGTRAEPYAAVPTLMLRLELREPSGDPVHAIALRAQIRIEPQRRRYSPAERSRLLELFGEQPQWGETVRPFLWTHASAMLPGFTGRAEVDLPITCTYDFEVAASKYLHALGDGEIPLTLLFSGTVLAQRNGALAVQPVAWHVEAHHRMPVAVWRDVMDQYFPNSGWIRLRRETIDALTRYKAERAIPSWDDAFEMLLKEAGS